MTLHQKLQKVSSEEDVKDIYIKALGLKEVQKNLIDIQTKEIWFEAKDNSKILFTQLMHYVQDALNKGHYVPPFLCVIDTQKAAIMKNADVIPFLEKKTIKWGTSASKYTQEALDVISAQIGTYFVSFKIETHEEEFINTLKNAIKKGDFLPFCFKPFEEVYKTLTKKLQPMFYELGFFENLRRLIYQLRFYQGSIP